MSQSTTPPARSGRVYGGITPAERAAQRRARFLDAGIELFGTIGYRATTVRALCNQAGLTDRYFYESFDDMESLLMSVYSACAGSLDAAILASIESNAGREAQRIVHGALDAFFAAVERDPRVARIVWLEVLGISPQVDRLYNRQVLHFAGQVGNLTRQVMPSVTLPQAEQDALCVALVGAVSQSAMYWLLSGYAAPRKTIVGANERLFNGLIQSLAAQPARASTRRKRP